MSRILLASLAVSSALLATGCPLAPGCGAYDGGGDRVYTRGTDMMIVCTNGGYSATIGSATHEGMVGSAGLTEGTTGAVVSSFTSIYAGVNAFDGDWTQQTLDTTALDHADAMCNDLATRSWWAEMALPEAQAFLLTDPETGARHVLSLCVDGTSNLAVDGEPSWAGSYSIQSGSLSISQFDGVVATYLTSQLNVGSDTWVIDENELPACK